MDYKFGTKNNWRRWAWNRIADRVENPRDSLVLFLAGSEALDVPVAQQHGFRQKNMIAVEKDRDILGALRARGVLAIKGDLFDVCRAWDFNRKVGVVVADLTCGLELNVATGLANLQLHPAFADSVFCVNLFHGRENTGKDWRQSMSSGAVQAGVVRHRGELLFEAVLVHLVGRGLKGLPEQTLDQHRAVVAQKCIEWAVAARPVFWQYRTSGSNYMDSVVFHSPVWGIAMAQHGATLGAHKFARSVPLAGSLRKQSQRTAAVLAHRTMRHGPGF